MNLFLLEDDYAIATGLCYSLEMRDTALLTHQELSKRLIL